MPTSKMVKPSVTFVPLRTICKPCLQIPVFLFPSGAGPSVLHNTFITVFQPPFFLQMSPPMNDTTNENQISHVSMYEGVSALYLFLQSSILKVVHIILKEFSSAIIIIVSDGMFATRKTQCIFLGTSFLMRRSQDTCHLLVLLLYLLFLLLLSLLILSVCVLALKLVSHLQKRLMPETVLLQYVALVHQLLRKFILLYLSLSFWTLFLLLILNFFPLPLILGLLLMKPLLFSLLFLFYHMLIMIVIFVLLILIYPSLPSPTMKPPLALMLTSGMPPWPMKLIVSMIILL
jgi:hypothetical protein